MLSTHASTRSISPSTFKPLAQIVFISCTGAVVTRWGHYLNKVGILHNDK